MKGNGRTLGASCPLCGMGSERLFRAHDHWVRRCTTCGHRYAEIQMSDDHVRRIYGDDYFTGGGAGYVDYLGDARLLREHGRRLARRLARYMSPGSVLDVGAAAGFVLEGLLEAGWQGAAIEPNEAMASRTRERLSVPVHCGTLADLPGGETFDLVLLLQVIAHFGDVQAELETAAQRTRIGGYWLIETWDRDSAAARVLGPLWHEYNPPSVLHWFSPAGLRQVARRYGFVEVARGRPLKFLTGARARSLLEHQLRSMKMGRIARPALSLIPKEATLPYFVGDLFWALFRRHA